MSVLPPILHGKKWVAIFSEVKRIGLSKRVGQKRTTFDREFRSFLIKQNLGGPTGSDAPALEIIEIRSDKNIHFENLSITKNAKINTTSKNNDLIPLYSLDQENLVCKSF